MEHDFSRQRMITQHQLRMLIRSGDWYPGDGEDIDLDSYVPSGVASDRVFFSTANIEELEDKCLTILNWIVAYTVDDDTFEIAAGSDAGFSVKGMSRKAVDRLLTQHFGQHVSQGQLEEIEAAFERLTGR